MSEDPPPYDAPPARYRFRPRDVAHLRGEVATLEALVAELRRYAMHRPGCPCQGLSVVSGYVPCTCGLPAVLARVAALGAPDA